ncbi:MAG TPA: LPS assembly lipoprotein LptE [Pontiella sp.]
MNRRLHLLNGLVVISLLSGCMGYQLGGSRPAGIEAVTLAPVINKTTEPAIELQITHAMRERIQFDGRMELVNMPEAADAVIEIVLTNYHFTPIAYRNRGKESSTPSLYRIRIDGNAQLIDAKNGNIISTSKTYGESVFEFQADLTSSKRNALPEAAKEIAKFILDDLIEQW